MANVYLHYVLDQWFHRTWRPRVPKGEAILVRYADDFVAGFQRRADAKRFLRDLGERCAEFGLELHPEKTRLVEFGRFAAADRRRRGERKPETFDFLGFTHYCAKTRKGRFRLGRKPSAKRMNRTLRRVGERLWRQRHADHWEVGKWLSRVLNGWPTILRFRGVRAGCEVSAICCNGGGCEPCAAGPNATASAGDGCDG